MAPSSIRKMTAGGADLVFIVNMHPPRNFQWTSSELPLGDQLRAVRFNRWPSLFRQFQWALRPFGLAPTRRVYAAKRHQADFTIMDGKGLHIIYGVLMAKTQMPPRRDQIGPIPRADYPRHAHAIAAARGHQTICVWRPHRPASDSVRSGLRYQRRLCHPGAVRRAWY